jgi:isopentenyl-diphosphate delta-isomerase
VGGADGRVKTALEYIPPGISVTQGDIRRRKDDHLDLASTDAVAFKERTTLLEDVQLVHQALPELSLDEIDLRAPLLGKRLRAPIVIAAMTGGTERAGAINRELAAIAEARGYGIGLGSQRAMQKDPTSAATFRVRDVAPTALLLGNIGVVQAREQPTASIQALVDEVGADALCVHMNPAMELVQPGGDRDFRGGLETFARLRGELGVPVVAKETGCGVSARVAEQLREIGVKTVDVSGAGGTSWVAVETLRAEGAQKELGETFWDWGIPTAVSVAWVTKSGLTPIATGGIKTGLDVARAIALGAHAAGIARTVLQALESGGREAAERYLDRIEAELRAAMLLTGSRTLAELRNAPRVLGSALTRWLA